VRGPDAVAGEAERGERATARQCHDGGQVGGGDGDRPAPRVRHLAAPQLREEADEALGRLTDFVTAQGA